MATDTQDPPAPPADTQDPPPTDWLQGVDADVKAHPSITKYKNVGELAKGHIEANKLVGMEKLPMPQKAFKEVPEEYNIVFDRLGRPSDPNAYVVPDVQYLDGQPRATEDEVKEFKGMAHKIGLMPHQVEALYKYHHERTQTAMKQSVAAGEGVQVATEKTLRTKYGTAFDAKLSQAKGFIQKFANDSLKAKIDGGLGNDADFIDMVIGASGHFGEDGEFLGEARVTVTMTPEEAQNEIAKIKGEASKDPKHAYINRKNPEHNAMVQKVAALHQMAYPESVAKE